MESVEREDGHLTVTGTDIDVAFAGSGSRTGLLDIDLAEGTGIFVTVTRAFNELTGRTDTRTETYPGLRCQVP